MQLFRANIAHFPTPNTASSTFAEDIVVIHDGGLVIDGKKIIATGSFSSMREQYPNALLHDHKDSWILPGLIDSHLHYPQTESIASYGEQLLSWLENYTFPTEKQFANVERRTNPRHTGNNVKPANK